MTNRTEAGAEKSFISTLLPWMIAGALALVYLLTVNHWISFNNMEAVERSTGHMWKPDVNAPLFVLVTSLFHWLPEKWVPLALNLFALVCAFFVLVLLARCVALFPHDRTEKQREKGRSAFASLSANWIPSVLAVLICGLQLTFWENATSLSMGMFDLVLFAYAVRCLMEYRVEKRESWLLRAAVVYAAAATDSWLFIALSPFFIASIIWIMGLSFFQLRFISRLFLCFLIGLLLYLYLPLLHLRSDGQFWEPLRQNLATEFYSVKGVFLYIPHYIQFLLVLTSILPIFVISIRWKAFSVDDVSKIGIALATWILHLAHLGLLVLCVWAEFDTGFGLRDPAGRFAFLSRARDHFLPLYFLCALSIGYLISYFLLVFKPLVRRGRTITSLDKFLSTASTIAIYALLVLAPIGLIFKNLPAIRYTNGPMLQDYAAAMADKLPAKAVVLSDDAASLLLTRSWLARSGKDQNFLFLDTHSFKYLGYYRFEIRKHPDQWPQAFTNIVNGDTVIPDLQLATFVRVLGEKHPVYYLHPTFGYYLDVFYPVPHGLVNELRPYTTNMFTPPPLSDAEVADNEAFWKEREPELASLSSGISEPPREKRTGRQRWMDSMQIPFEQNITAGYLGMMYSRALNTWGVAAQRASRLESATAHFDKAVQLASDNIVASANLDFNKKLRKGDHIATDNPTAFQDRFGNIDDWEGILDRCGSFDEPTGCLAEGIVFHKGHLERQALQNFERSLALAPDSLLSRLWLARVYVVVHQPEKSLALIDELKARSKSLAEAAIYPADILQVELAANYVNDSQDKVDRIVKSTLSPKAADPILVDTTVQVASFYRDYTNALLALDKQLQMSPNNVTSLFNKGYIYIQLTNYDAAIPPLNQAISLAPTNTTAIFCRALSYFQTGKLDEAQHDFEQLRQLNPKAYPSYHGLAEIALRRKDTNTAILNFQLDLSNAPPNSPESAYATQRLKTLTNKPSP